MEERLTFFLADDDPDDRLLLTEAIKSIDSNTEIVEAENGRELLAILQFNILPVNSLIILDMNMPVMNGLETMANLRNIPKLASVPAVMLSTSSNQDMVEFARHLGAVDYFVKPSTMDGLVALCRRFISGKIAPGQ